jgi:hypothetical protein
MLRVGSKAGAARLVCLIEALDNPDFHCATKLGYELTIALLIEIATSD